MNVDWQTATVLGLIAVAAVYVLRRGRRALSSKQAAPCGTCPHCAASSRPKPFVEIDPPPE